MRAGWITVLGVLPMMALAQGNAWAQVDLSGNWSARYHEDQPERIPGPELTDFLGLPLSEEGRRWALSWDPSG